MKLFKPYVNLTKKVTKNNVEQYTLHSVINLPAAFQYHSTNQQEIETPAGEQKWMVTLNFTHNGACLANTMMQEFDTVLLEGPTDQRKKIGICITSTEGSSIIQATSCDETDLNYDDAGDEIE